MQVERNVNAKTSNSSSKYILQGGEQLFGAHTHFQREYTDWLWAREKSVKAEKRDRNAERALSAFLSLFSAFTLFSRAHNRSVCSLSKYIVSKEKKPQAGEFVKISARSVKVGVFWHRPCRTHACGDLLLPPPNMFLSLVSFVAESLDTWSAGAEQHCPSTQQKSLQAAQWVTWHWQYCMQSRIGRVSDHCMRWCVHRAFRWWSFGCRTRTRLDSNSCVDSGFFLRVLSLDLSSSTYFPLFQLALRPASTPNSHQRRSSISPPRDHVAFSLAKQVSFEHSISSPSLLLLREGKKNIQTNDRQMTRQKVSPQFVVDRSSARPDRDRGQRCSAATSLATASTGTVLLPSQMSQIAGHEVIWYGHPSLLSMSNSWPGLDWNKLTVRYFLFFLFLSVDLEINLQSPTPGAIQYIIVLERYNPTTRTFESYSQDTTNFNQFPFTIRNLPAGFYRAQVDALVPTGVRTVSSTALQLGTPGMAKKVFRFAVSLCAKLITMVIWARWHGAFKLVPQVWNIQAVHKILVSNLPQIQHCTDELETLQAETFKTVCSCASILHKQFLWTLCLILKSSLVSKSIKILSTADTHYCRFFI